MNVTVWARVFCHHDNLMTTRATVFIPSLVSYHPTSIVLHFEVEILSKKCDGNFRSRPREAHKLRFNTEAGFEKAVQAHLQGISF